MHAIARADLHLAHRHRVVILDHIHIGAAGAGLDGRGRHQHGLGERIHDELHIDELIREQGVVPIRELRLELDGAGGGVDLVVDARDGPGGEQLAVLRIPGLHRQFGALPQAREHRRQLLLRDREHHADRLHLGDDDQPVGVRGLHEIADVDLLETGAARDRRRHMGVRKLQLGLRDGGLVDIERGLVLRDLGGLGIDLLGCDRILLQQGAVAREVDFGRGEQGLVLGELRLGAVDRDAETARIDLREHLAGLDRLTFGEIKLFEPARDLHPHGGGIACGHGAERADAHIHAAGRGGQSHHRHGARAWAAGPTGAARCAAAGMPLLPAVPARPREREPDQRRDHKGAATRRTRRGGIGRGVHDGR